MRDKSLKTLLDMHTYCRPYGTAGDRMFCKKWIETLPNVERDGLGNYHVSVGESRILWSCHTDTVHDRSGRQTVFYNPANGLLKLSRQSKRSSRCLGSDDTAGVWLAREMILAGIPGHYIFHYGEESGGIGSSALADTLPNLLDGFQIAIALDRASTSDVITCQGGTRTASDRFAQSLADGLNASPGMAYKPCPHGIYTDTAEYKYLIPECTNLSVGYTSAHSPNETLDVWHLYALLAALCTLDQSALIVERDHTAKPIAREWSEWRDYFDRDTTDRSLPLDYLDPLLDAEQDTEYDHLWRELDDRQTERSVYLDPIFEQVQTALRLCKR